MCYGLCAKMLKLPLLVVPQGVFLFFLFYLPWRAKFLVRFWPFLEEVILDSVSHGPIMQVLKPFYHGTRSVELERLVLSIREKCKYEKEGAGKGKAKFDWQGKPW